MSPRTGRPKIENPKDHDIKVRVDSETNRKIIAYAEKYGLARTEVIRRAISQFLASEE